MEEAKDELESYVEALTEPKTLAEIREDLGRKLTPAELEQTLQQLIMSELLVCREIDTDSNLYWKLTPQSVQTPHTVPDTGTHAHGVQSPLVIRKPSPRARRPFKSPAVTRTPRTAVTPNRTTKHLHIPHSFSRAGKTPATVEAEIRQLQSELVGVEREIAELSASYSECELESHIAALHSYNEVKDVGQTVLGKLAEVEGTTTASLYKRYGLELDS